MYGSGRRARTWVIRDSSRILARSASTTGSGWPTSGYCAARRAPRRSRTRDSPIETSFHRMLGGNSWGFDLPITRDERSLAMTAPRHGVPRIAPRPDASPMREEVLRGLHSEPKTLPPKLFSDEAGAALFEQICELPEYYLTRAELEILGERAGEIAELAGPRVALLEYGSGAGVKIRLLLDALESPAAFAPIDISREQLGRVARELAAEYPGVAIRPLHADYTLPLAVPPLPEGSRRVAFFPGSTIGNFHPMEAAIFLGRVRRAVGKGGALILGVDGRKSAATLNAAYDDSPGVATAFNLEHLAIGRGHV